MFFCASGLICFNIPLFSPSPQRAANVTCCHTLASAIFQTCSRHDPTNAVLAISGCFPPTPIFCGWLIVGGTVGSYRSAIPSPLNKWLQNLRMQKNHPIVIVRLTLFAFGVGFLANGENWRIYKELFELGDMRFGVKIVLEIKKNVTKVNLY